MKPAPIGEAESLRESLSLLGSLARTWQGKDPISIADSVLQFLRDQLGLEFVGVRFDDAPYIFSRASEEFGTSHDPRLVQLAVTDFLALMPQETRALLSIGGVDRPAMALPMGRIASIGVLIASARRIDFPQTDEVLVLRAAVTEASLTIREVRERNDHSPPADARVDRPSAAALAESEWRLSLIINTIPAIAWSATADGVMDFCNQHFLDFVGLSANDILGFGFYQVFHPDDLQRLREAWQEEGFNAA